MKTMEATMVLKLGDGVTQAQREEILRRMRRAALESGAEEVELAGPVRAVARSAAR